jgi:hypothetical protein
MTKYHNIFIVTTPLQLMNSIEAIEYFKLENNTLLVLYMCDKTLLQIKKLLKFIDWFDIKFIPLPNSILDKIFFSKTINSSIKEIKNRKIGKIFVGDYESEHLNHIVNCFKNKNIYLVDDGMAVSFYNKKKLAITTKIKIRRLIYQALLYKLSPIKYTFFTIFDIENEESIKNGYLFFNKYINKKNVINKVYFIGQHLIEANIMTKEIYRDELSKIIDFYKGKEFIYILHRSQKEYIIKELANELGFKYKRLDNLIELEMINSMEIPSNFATFYSTAIMTLPRFIKDSDYRVFKSKDKNLNKNFVSRVDMAYKEFKKMGLKVEEL